MTNTEKQSDVTGNQLEEMFAQAKLPEKYQAIAVDHFSRYDGPVMMHHVLNGLRIAQERMAEDQQISQLMDQLTEAGVKPSSYTQTYEFDLTALPDGGFKWPSRFADEPGTLIKVVRVTVTRYDDDIQPNLQVEAYVVPFTKSGKLSARQPSWTWLPVSAAESLLGRAITSW